MNEAFKQLAKDFFRYKKQFLLTFFTAFVNAFCFGMVLFLMKAVIGLWLDYKDGYTLTEYLEPYVDKLGKGLLEFSTLPWSPISAQTATDIHTTLSHFAASMPQDAFYGLLIVFTIILLLVIIGNIGKFLQEWIVLTVVTRVAMHWRIRLMRKVLFGQYLSLQNKGQSDHLVRVTNDTTVLANALRQIFGKTLGEVLKSIGGVMAAFALNWQLTLLALIGAPAIGIILKKFGKTIRRASKRALGRRGKLTAVILECISGIQVVKVFGAEGYERRRFNLENRELYNDEMSMRTARAMSSPVVDVISMFCVMLVGIVASYMVVRKGFDAKDLITVFTALGASAAGLKPISNLNNQIHESAAAAERITELMEIDQEPLGKLATQEPKPQLPSHQQSVTFNDIHYTYPNQDLPALKGISLDVKYGMEVAIVGGNGSGKSTLLSMLPRLLTPSTGQVLIDGHDINNVNLRSLRQQIAVVTQQSILFQGSVADNIAYNHRHISREQIVEAAKLAYAHDFIENLPGGYDYQLVEGGKGLSGGQCQRLCIARAILRDPAILILDEATSQIDAESEAKINAALHNIREGRTLLVIAHRLSTVVDADMIVVMDDGRIIDTGTHDQLLKTSEIYKQLTLNQLVKT